MRDFGEAEIELGSWPKAKKGVEAQDFSLWLKAKPKRWFETRIQPLAEADVEADWHSIFITAKGCNRKMLAYQYQPIENSSISSIFLLG